ncbi:hypothetical protein HDU98_003757 [Podochytrium sp. JEL0797]|nr:hypothetical protein HDU98_003757 [Podochytrium sp. JEL0797]
MPSYDLSFHILGLFIVLFCGGLGIFTTLSLGIHMKAPIFVTILQLFKMFGIGVIAATAWVHLLPDSFTQFAHPCLPEGWRSYAFNFVGLFGMIAAFLVQIIELSIVDYKNKWTSRRRAEQGASVVELDNVSISSKQNTNSTEMTFMDAVPAGCSGSHSPGTHEHEHVGIARDAELGTIMLECGIIFHSVIIGVTLGVTPDHEFTTIMIAICFHQMFEGMALGVLIGELNFSVTAKRSLCLAYPLTTPIGIALGIAMRSFYNANDPNLVLVQGIMNALSAGILMYNTYTELMSAEISHNVHFQGFSAKFKMACFFAMYLATALPHYDLQFHILGLFIVLFSGGLGIFTTLCLGIHMKAPIFVTILQLFKMFGIGVIAATAWIHLLPDSFTQFAHPCLPEGWRSYAFNFVGLFGMIAAFLVQIIELSIADYKNKSAAQRRAAEETSVPELENVWVTSKPATTEMTFADAVPAGCSGGHSPDAHAHEHKREYVGITRDAELGTIMLECGIIFHSVIIGVTLGVTPDHEFTTIMIAICFHQMFEGMALGVLIGELNFTVLTKRLLCLVYPLTTPIGIALGIAMRSFYNANDPNLVVFQGIMDALSAGILMYNTYTELMSAEISHNVHFQRFSAYFKTACFFSMYLGAATMAVIGVWA